MISYNDLYELVRKEKYAETLQPLPKDFLKDYVALLTEIKNGVEQEISFIDSSSIGRKQLENSIAIFRELISKRKRKILSLVYIATDMGIMKRDYENMLPVERELFDKLVKAFEEGEKGMEKLLSGSKEKDKKKQRMVMFNQDVEQFVDMKGELLGPFTSGELVNLDSGVAEILVSGGKAGFVDED
jgi:DNA replication initiation complex subunit (GINS family)